MGCNSSKPAVEQTKAASQASSNRAAAETVTTKNRNGVSSPSSSPTRGSKNNVLKSLSGKQQPLVSSRDKAELYTILVDAKKRDDLKDGFWSRVLTKIDAPSAGYKHPKSKKTALHIACSLVDKDDGCHADEESTNSVVQSIRALIREGGTTVSAKDAKGFLPLHYVLSGNNPVDDARLGVRLQVIQALAGAHHNKSCKSYLSSNKVIYNKQGDNNNSGTGAAGVTPLYHALQTLPDDFDPQGTTVEYVSCIHQLAPRMVVISNDSDQDKPLALLYRRFTRQFDLSEKFFTGDNSRPEVVDHRKKYKIAAGNTWKTIEILLKPPPLEKDNDDNGNDNDDDDWKVVHRAIQVETPPDLLRYIVETNAEEMTQPDQAGNLPLHYAAKSIPAESSFPAFYSKYVVDELLYKFPEAAAMPDGNGDYPLALAVQTGKQWIGGGVKSLYDAYPQALEQIDLDAHASLKKALSFESEKEDTNTLMEPDEGEQVLTSKGIVRDEHHDAIMAVQRPDVEISEIVSAMWAHEEDAGVQMLGCVAIDRIVSETTNNTTVEKLRIALSALAAVVNAMKAHPNEPVVQDKACSVLKQLAPSDGDCEISFIASGAIAAIVGAMQAHVGDPNVQEESCGAISEIVRHGGAERATVVASVSGVTALVNALAAHPDQEGVQREGCRALIQISNHPQQANVPDLPRSPLEQVLDAARQQFPASCQEDADILLSRLPMS